MSKTKKPVRFLADVDENGKWVWVAELPDGSRRPATAAEKSQIDRENQRKIRELRDRIRGALKRVATDPEWRPPFFSARWWEFDEWRKGLLPSYAPSWGERAIRAALSAREMNPPKLNGAADPQAPESDDTPERKKRSTAPGEARVKIIAGLTLHHQYENGSCGNPCDPIGVNKFAKELGIMRSTVSAFLKKEFGCEGESGDGWARYRAACLRDKGKDLTYKLHGTDQLKVASNDR